MDPIRKHQMKINKIHDNLKLRRSMTENNSNANMLEAERLKKLKKNLLSLPTEEALLNDEKEEPKEGALTHKLTQQEKIMSDETQRKAQQPKFGKGSIVVLPKSQVLSKKSESFKSENFESDITSSSDDDDASSNSGHNIWKDDKKSVVNSSQSSSSSDDSKKREEKKEVKELKFERLKTFKMLQGKKTAKFGSQSTHMQQMSMQSFNINEEKRQTQNSFSPSPLLQVNAAHQASLFAPNVRAATQKQSNSNISVGNILRPSGTSTTSLYSPPHRLLTVDSGVIQVTIAASS